MHHVVILAHPAPTSFNAGAAQAYAEAVRALGDECTLRDLYRQDFDPRLMASELPWSQDFAVPGDVAAEREIVSQAQCLLFVYPLWFNAPPAMLKGYVERVFGIGFAYGAEFGGTQPLLQGKRLISISTSGAPDAWVDQTGAVERLQEGFDRHLAAVCGLTVLDHLHLGGVTPGIRRDAAEAMFDQVRAMAARHFSPAT
jgi:NAD(P)H dehydrogenase (quinone)